MLVRVAGGARLSPLLSATCTRLSLVTTDRAWLGELANGTLRHQASLDAALATHLTHKPSSLPPPVLVALRIGAYQLLHMRTPAHAAVHATVNLVPSRFGRLRGVANAVLRKLAANAQTAADRLCALPTLSADTIAVWAREVSQPEWFVAAIAGQLGFDAAAQFLRANNERPPLHMRCNLTRSAPAALTQALDATGKCPTAPWPALPLALCLTGSGEVTALPGFAEGYFAVQDGAAQAVGHLLAPPAGATVLDACAAPGGKTTHLLDMVGPGGRVVAVDIHPGRLQTVSRNAERLGLGASLQPLLLDLAAGEDVVRPALAAAGGPFDYVLLDAPCSGMGTLRRHPELRSRPGATLASLTALQATLLDAMASVVAPGGMLVYAVCSPLHEEGRTQIGAFLQRHNDFAVQPAPAHLRPYIEEEALVTWPHRDGLDAFFACKLVRTRN